MGKGAVFVTMCESSIWYVTKVKGEPALTSLAQHRESGLFHKPCVMASFTHPVHTHQAPQKAY